MHSNSITLSLSHSVGPNSALNQWSLHPIVAWAIISWEGKQVPTHASNATKAVEMQTMCVKTVCLYKDV